MIKARERDVFCMPSAHQRKKEEGEEEEAIPTTMLVFHEPTAHTCGPTSATATATKLSTPLPFCLPAHWHCSPRLPILPQHSLLHHASPVEKTRVQKTGKIQIHFRFQLGVPLPVMIISWCSCPDF
jgi:hypothetical protein